MNVRWALLPLALLAATGASTLFAAEPPTLEDCDARVATHPGNFEAYRCYWLAGRREGRLADAARKLDARLAVQPDEPGALLYLGMVEADRGAMRTLDLFLAAVDAFVARGDLKGEVYARISAFYALSYRGRLDEADVELDAAEVAANASGIPELPVRVLAERGGRALGAEDFGLAYVLLREARDRLGDDMPPDLAGRVLSALGVACWRTGRMEESREAFRAEAEHHQRRGNAWDEALARANLMLYGLPSIPREERRARALDAVEFARAAGNPSAEHVALRQLANWSDRDERLRLRRELLASARNRGDGEATIAALRLLGFDLAVLAPGDINAGLALLDEAVTLARSLGREIETVHALANRAQLRRKVGLHTAATEDWAVAIAGLESIRDAQPEPLTRRRVASQGRWVYEALALSLLDDPAVSPQDLALAFETLERMRGGSVVDAFGTTRERPEAFAAWSRTLEEIALQQRKLLDAARDALPLDEILAHLERLETREATERELAARAAGEVARPPRATLDQIQRGLEPRQALLVFVLPHRPLDQTQRGYVIAVTRERVQSHAIDEGGHALVPLVELFLELLARGDGAESRAAVRLHEALLGPALRALGAGIDRLIVVPDGALHGLPLDVLAESVGAPPLAERYAVAVVPSASAWRAVRERATTGERDEMLILADPQTDTAAANRRDAAVLGVAGLGTLPHARSEAGAVSRLASRVEVHFGAGASERLMKTIDLRRFGIVHFAAHAVVDPTHPDRSAVVLSPGAEEEDGLLQVREIPRLELDGALVVLSACESATGAVLSGEGVLGLPDAFLRGGARAVIGTLWAVRDEAASTFMNSFYRHLARGLTLAEALAAAKRDRRHAGEATADWAAFILVGDGDWAPRFEAQRVDRRITVTVLGLLAAAALIVLLRRNH